MKKTAGKRGTALALALLLALLFVPECLALSGIQQVNAHLGQEPGTVYLTYAAPESSATAVTVTGQAGTTEYTARAVWSEDAGKYLYTAVLEDLSPGTAYTYEIDGDFTGSFRTAAEEGAFTFAFLTDTQVAAAADARSTGALFARLNGLEDLAFAYVAGDLTDSIRRESQWELLFRSGGVNDGAGQEFFAGNLIAVAQGNHDNRTFAGHITAPSAGEDVGPVVYAFDYSNVRFIVLNLSNPDTRQAQADFLRAEVACARAAGQWVVVGFHQSLYPCGTHIVDSILISARTFWSPLLAELGVDVVLQGHDHVYARGFVTGEGKNAGFPVIRNSFHAGSGAPLYLTGGTSGAAKWYGARSYRISAGDPLTPAYGFLDVASTLPARNPWGTDTSQTREQTYTLIQVDGDTMTFSTYMFRYDGKTDRMVTEPYLYDSLILRRDGAAQADLEVLEALEAPEGEEITSAGYADVAEDAWYAGAVNALAQLNALEDGAAFDPDGPLTRAALVTALWRLSGEPETEDVPVFPDVSGSASLADAVSWAAGAGIVSGLSDGTFAPERAVTRDQLAVMLWRWARHAGADTRAGSGTGTYADWRQVGQWCAPAMSWAVDTGILRGRNGNRLAPRDTVSRAEGAVMLYRLVLLTAAAGTR